MARSGNEEFARLCKKTYFKDLLMGTRGVLAKRDLNRLPAAGLPASQLRCVARHDGARPRDAGTGATQAACCPLQSARPHHRGGSCLSKGSPGSVGLAISVAQLSSHVAAALQRTFRVLWHEFIWIPLCGTERPCISSAHMGYLWKATVYLFVRSV